MSKCPHCFGDMQFGAPYCMQCNRRATFTSQSLVNIGIIVLQGWLLLKLFEWLFQI